MEVEEEILLTGIETSKETIACVQQSARKMRLTQLSFAALDSTAFATGEGSVPELVLVNPPRRGIGAKLCDYLEKMVPPCCSMQAVMP